MFSVASGLGDGVGDDDSVVPAAAVVAPAAAGDESSDQVDFGPAAVEADATLSLAPIDNIEVPGTKSVLVPLAGFDSSGEPITYTFSSSNAAVQLALVSTNSQTLSIAFTGKDMDGSEFGGTIKLRLFEDLAPATTARIKSLVNQGFYNNSQFHRILDGFVAQAGSGFGLEIKEEFNAGLTFNSRGLLAMANRGRDTSDSQFFITATNAKNSSDPISLADMPEDLNFRYTIFGQLVSGFEVFERMMQTDVQTNTQTGELSQPYFPITITSATIIDDDQTAVLRVSSSTGFSGDATITVTAHGSTGDTVVQTFTAAGVADVHPDPPFIADVTNKTVAAGSPLTFTLTSTDPSGNGRVYRIFDPATQAAPANVVVNIDQPSGQVTITPNASFTGTLNLVAGVRAAGAADAFANYDTSAFRLTVTAASSVAAPTGLSVMTSTTAGPFDDAGFVTTATPTLTVNAVTGATVQIKRGGTVIATATETATGSGVYRATLPAGALAVGANSFTATATTTDGTSPDSTALAVTFAPDYASGVYVVPGAAGASQSLTFAWTSKNAAYSNEFGYAVVSAATGAIGGVAPGDAGYAQALLNSATRTVLFAKGAQAGATKTVTLTGGQFVVFYMIQNNTTDNFLAKNAANDLQGNNNPNAPLAFFSVPAANPDHQKHAQIIADATTGFVQYNWEDLAHLGDSDFNDAAITVRSTSQTVASPAGVRAPGSTGNVTVTGNLKSGSQNAPLGDVGVFFVDGPSGAIGSLLPGDSGYVAAALAAANRAVLYSAGATGSKQATAPAGKYLGFYAISTGTTANFLAVNPTNSATGSAVALFSFNDANPDDGNYFRWVSPGSQAANPNAMQLHVNTRLGSGDAGFDAFSISVGFAT